MDKKSFKYRSIGVDNSKKSYAQFLKDRLYDANHVCKLLDEQEKVIRARGEDIKRRFKHAEEILNKESDNYK